jgi:hypothetical protein
MKNPLLCYNSRVGKKPVLEQSQDVSYIRMTIPEQVYKTIQEYLLTHQVLTHQVPTINFWKISFAH